MMRAKGPDGRVYEFGPELWGDMNLPRDHSAWARSVRWSCGRPGYTRPQLVFDYHKTLGQQIADEYGRALLRAQIQQADGDGFLRITGV